MAKKEEQATLENKVKIKDAGPCKKKISIEIPEQTIKQATDEQYETLRKDALLPGFRKGRAPRRLLEKRFGKDTSEQIKLKLVADASDTAVKDNEIDPLRDPDIKHEDIELPEEGSMKFDFEVEVRPEFKLPELEGIPVNKTKHEIGDEQIDAEIEQLCKYSGMWAPREDGQVEIGDQIIADAILKIEDVEEEEKLDNTEIFVRENGSVGAVPVDGLGELLEGAKAGETRQKSVEVPKTYFKEEYRGKKIDVSITVKDIKWLKPAEVDENFFKKVGVEDENQLRETIQDLLQGRVEQQSRQEMTNQIYKYMLDKINFDLPTEIVADQAQTLLQRNYMTLLRQGLSVEQLKEQTEQLNSSSEQQAKEQLKTFFIMDKVAKKLEISVTEEEVNGHIARIAIQRGQRPEKMREDMVRDGSLAQFTVQVREEKCIAKLLESAKITEIKPKKAAKKAKKTKKATKKTEKTTKKAVKSTTKKAETTSKKETDN